MLDEEQEFDDAVAGGNGLQGSVGSDTERLRPSVPRRGDRFQGQLQLPDLLLEQAQVLVQRMPTMAGLSVGGRMPRMKTEKVVSEAAKS